jgi:hypothetical protein
MVPDLPATLLRVCVGKDPCRPLVVKVHRLPNSAKTNSTQLKG